MFNHIKKLLELKTAAAARQESDINNENDIAMGFQNPKKSQKRKQETNQIEFVSSNKYQVLSKETETENSDIDREFPPLKKPDSQTKKKLLSYVTNPNGQL